MKPKNTICLWYDKDAHEAARFYEATFPDSRVMAVREAPADYPSGKKGDVLVVEFTVLGIPCLGLNGGPEFKHSEAFSFQIATDNQEETDRYWNAIVGNGGQESQCGWCKDRWSVSWQITPRALVEQSLRGSVENQAIVDAAMVDRYWELLRFPGNREATVLRARRDREPAMAARVGEITAPTLILFGTEDRIINASAAQTFHERIAGSEVVLLDDIGHLPMEEAPDATAEAIADFLTRRLAAPEPRPETR